VPRCPGPSGCERGLQLENTDAVSPAGLPTVGSPPATAGTMKAVIVTNRRAGRGDNNQYFPPRRSSSGRYTTSGSSVRTLRHRQRLVDCELQRFHTRCPRRNRYSVEWHREGRDAPECRVTCRRYDWRVDGPVHTPRRSAHRGPVVPLTARPVAPQQQSVPPDTRKEADGTRWAGAGRGPDGRDQPAGDLHRHLHD
jgi:hypothetical protein